jgi:hypothetical protein
MSRSDLADYATVSLHCELTMAKVYGILAERFPAQADFLLDCQRDEQQHALVDEMYVRFASDLGYGDVLSFLQRPEVQIPTLEAEYKGVISQAASVAGRIDESHLFPFVSSLEHLSFEREHRRTFRGEKPTDAFSTGDALRLWERLYAVGGEHGGHQIITKLPWVDYRQYFG